MRGSILIAILIIGMFSAEAATAAQRIAVGYIENKSGQSNYDYLETIFANSFGNSLRNISSGIHVTKPLKLSRILKRKKAALKKRYKPYEYPEILKLVNADYFITGGFVPHKDNRITITVSIYKKCEPFYFRFTSTGKMETEIFRLVDQITSVLIFYMSQKKLYKTKNIVKGKRIGILTNLKGDELNDVYLPLVSRGYKLASLQGNEVDNPIIDRNNIRYFYNITTANTGLTLISDPRKYSFPIGTWSQKEDAKKTLLLKEMVTKHDTNAIKTFNSILSSFTKRTNMDYLLIIAFSPDRSHSWVRCIDTKTKNIIWIQRGIKGCSVYQISDKISQLLSVSAEEIYFKKQNKKR